MFYFIFIFIFIISLYYESNIIIKCIDKYNNVIPKSGENFRAIIKVDSDDELE